MKGPYIVAQVGEHFDRPLSWHASFADARDECEARRLISQPQDGEYWLCVNLYGRILYQTWSVAAGETPVLLSVN